MPRALLILALILSCAAALPRLCAQALLPADTPMRVYVGSIEGPDRELAQRVRARLVDDLIARGIALVESDENADAILTGSYVRQTAKKVNVGRRTNLCIRGDLRLTAPLGLLLWSNDLSSDRYALSQTASFVDKAGKEIDHALALAARRRSTDRLPWQASRR